MKLSAIFKAFAVGILVLSVAVTADTITFGNKGPHDRLLARFVVAKGSMWSVQTETVQYPPKGYTNNKMLTAINLIEEGDTEGFGHAELLKGGPGYPDATILLKSKRGKPIKYTIEYYSSA